MKVALSAKELDILAEKKKKNYVKLLKKTYGKRWVSLHAGVGAVCGEYKGLYLYFKRNAK